jgi:putative glutamine amidotransferase
MKRKIVIGITDCGSYTNYEKWFNSEAGVETIRLSYKENNFDQIARCNGIVLSGGEDVHPRFYNKKEYIGLCHEIDERRDDFEWRVLETVEEKKLPLLGICRGLQMANVFYGGTLIPDIPSFGKYNHSKFSDRDRYHSISVDQESILFSLVNDSFGEINSAHHQSADRVGKGLVVNSFSPEGIIEGIERLNPSDLPFLMLVQWHPERMKDQENPFSKRIKSGFLQAVAETEN